MLVTPLAFPGDIVTPMVYEFLSFEELRLDLRDMIVGEMEAWSLWLAVIAFGLSAIIGAIRMLGGGAERRRLVREVAAEVTCSIQAGLDPSVPTYNVAAPAPAPAP
jgi:hypothetical protein